MSGSVTLNQYWRLILAMILPARYVKWLGILTFAALASGTILYFFDISFVLYIGSALSLLLMMMVGMLLPGQMLSLRSSKQFQCMADLRRPLFIIAFNFWLLVSLILTATAAFLEPKEFEFNSVFTFIFMVLSGVALLFMAVGSYVQTAQGFVPLFVWIVFFSAKETDLFSSSAIGINWLITLGLWLAMIIWWFRWRPQKYLINCMTLPAAEMQRQQANSVQSITRLFSAAPKTLAGSLLMGMSDGSNARLKRELGQLVSFLLMLALMLYWLKKVPTHVAGLMVSICVFIFICIRGGVIFQGIFRNLYRLWMNSSYSRAEIFSYVEKRYFLLLVSSIVPTMLVFVLINHYVLDGWVSLFSGAYLLLIGYLICSFSFYLGLFIYIKSAASFLWLNWIGSIVNIGLVGLMVYFQILFGRDPSQDHIDHLAFCALLLVLILFGRAWVKSHWRTLNFFRVKN